MAVQTSEIDGFTEFVDEHEANLRESLIAACGGEHGRDAAAEALVYGWRHWDRISEMENPVGYVYKVGLSRGRRSLAKRRPVFDAVEWALRYFLLGAVVVFPIWLIARIIKMAGKGGSAGSHHSSSPQAEQ